MRVEHEYPEYTDEKVRAEKVQEIYGNIQRILYNKRQDKNMEKNINSSQRK